jgi:hypothetical protein
MDIKEKNLRARQRRANEKAARAASENGNNKEIISDFCEQ